jgi:hypothetical protein
MSHEHDDGPVAGSEAAWSRADVGLEGAPTPVQRYARGGELGRGGMGVVEAATDTWLGRDVAVKRPRAAGVGLDRLLREARITARLVHPCIPPIYDVGEDAAGPFYTMPVLAGETLHERLAARSSSLRALVSAVAQVAGAAGYAHAMGVVHRDLKPANVLLGRHGEVWLLDWGVAYDPAQPDVAVVGTPGFQAPEQAQGRVVGPAADVFGLGRVLAAVLDAAEAPHAELRAVVERCTEAEPGRRYKDGAALSEELERWLEGLPVQAHAYTALEVLRRALWRWRAPVLVGVVAAGVGLVFAVGAWRAQQAERARADRALSTSLAQQAASLRARGARPEAEVLAAHSLRLHEDPLARGVLMGGAGSPRPRLVERRALPCERAVLEADGSQLCVGALLQRFDPAGALLWSAALTPPVAERGRTVGEVVEARAYASGEVLLRRTSNHLERWSAGARLGVIDLGETVTGLAKGPVPAVFVDRRLGVFGPDGALRWGEPSCELVASAWVDEAHAVIGCHEAAVAVGTWEHPGLPVPTEGFPSAVSWAGLPVIGTHDGRLLFGVGEGAWAVPSGVGAPRHLLPLPGERVAVLGERGWTQVWSVPRRAAVLAMPRGGTGLAVHDGLWLKTEELRRYALPDALRPGGFDLTADGGVSSLAISPSGHALAAGSANGRVRAWEVESGAARVEGEPTGNTAKGLVFLDDTRLLATLSDRGLVRFELAGGAPQPVAGGFGREARRWKGGVAMTGWGSGVTLVGLEPSLLSLPTRAMALAADERRLWAADERGGVFVEVDGALERRFELAATGLALCGEQLVASVGASIESHDARGGLNWRWTGSSPISALTASDRWIAAGDLDGRVLVLTPDGRLVASLAAHGRRVSDVVLHGDRLFSASWDGRVERWGLGELLAPAADLVERTRVAWGLSLERALVGADPL